MESRRVTRKAPRKSNARAQEKAEIAARTGEMLALAETMVAAAIRELTEGVPPARDVAAQDRELGALQRSIRRRIVAHLHEHPESDVLDCVTYLTLIVFVERLGDYAKNLHEIHAALPRPFAELSRATAVTSLSRGILEMFRLTRVALTAEGDAEARRAIALHGDLAAEARAILDDLLHVPGTDPREAVATALAVRYLKRTSSHLMNVASTVITAFDEIGYHPDKRDDVPPIDD